MTTEAGVVVYELFYQQTPLTVANHVGLAEGTLGPARGEPFYDDLSWHRVEANFLVQGGDGMPKYDRRLGYSFPDEVVPGLRHDGPGTVQMANSGPDTNGSQFCIMLSDQTGLNYNHTVFGKVVRGLDVLPKIKAGDTMKIRVLRLGDQAKAFKADEATFNGLVAAGKRFEGPRAPGPEAFLDDPENIVGTTGRGSTFLQFKLANFYRFTGERIMARIYGQTPAEAKGEQLDAFVNVLAQRLNVAERGALVVYLRDQDKWIVRIGAQSRPPFVAGPLKPDGTRDPIRAAKTFDEALEEYLTLVLRPLPATAGRGTTQPASQPSARSAATAPAATQRGRGRGAPGVPGVAQRLSVVLDNLIFRLEPSRPTGR
jgi:cyclophilin family peptidyl-prolyl cis-trans isomerase